MRRVLLAAVAAAALVLVAGVAKRKQNEDCDVVIVTKAPGGSQDRAYRP
jgi:hypothetical protein